MEARHLLYVYLSVWLIQGGYAAWVLREWMRTRKPVQPPTPLTPVTPVTRED